MILQDVGAVSRRLGRDWGSALLIVGLLAAAFAVNTSVFAVANALLWKPLPFPAESRLVHLAARSARMGIDLGWSIPYLSAVASNSSQLEAVAAYRRMESMQTDVDGTPLRLLQSLAVEPHLLLMLGANIEVGRLFETEDARVGAEPAALISEGVWRSSFGGSRDVLEKKIFLDGKAHRIVGVMPAKFVFPSDDVSVWVPLGFSESDVAMSNAGSFGNTGAIGRIRAGSNFAAATASMMAAVHSEPTLDQIGQEIGLQLSAEPLRSLWVEGREKSLKSLLGVGAMLLVVTLANVYNLFVLRLLARRQEFALLEVVGATRLRRLGLLVIEVGLLCACGALVALLLTSPGLEFLRYLNVLPAGIPQQVGLDGNTAILLLLMLLVSAALISSGGVAFLRQNVFDVLRQTGNGQTAGARVQRLKQVLVIVQISMTLVLLFGTSLLVRSSNNLLRQDVGFEREGRVVAVLQASMVDQEGSADAVRSQIAVAQAQLESTPGVKAVGLSTSTPFGKNVTLEAVQGPSTNSRGNINILSKAYVSHVSADYPIAAGIEILRGRRFSQSEAIEAAPVVLIDEDMASSFFENQDPLGQTVRVANSVTGELEERTVVGVVSRVRQRTLAEKDSFPSLYLPSAIPFAVPGLPTNSIEMIIKSDVANISSEQVKNLLQSSAPRMRPATVVTMEQRIEDTIVELIRLNSLLKLLAGLSLLLSAVGLYALLSNSVMLRTREFGVRVALGASPMQLILLVLRQGASTVIFAVATSVPFALLLGASIRDRLYGVSFADPASFAAVTFLLLLIASLANLIPALRASRVAPNLALRYE